MAFTSHGHHIPGSILDDGPRPPQVARCGGPKLCPVCRREGFDFLHKETQQTMTETPYMRGYKAGQALEESQVDSEEDVLAKIGYSHGYSVGTQEAINGNAPGARTL